MDTSALSHLLAPLNLGQAVYLASTGSTNDEAAALAAAGAPDLTLVAADEQTAGRGRAGRTWFTPPGAALAFSLLIRPQPAESRAGLARFSALGALAVAAALREQWNLPAQVKWPNDVLVHGKKVAGVLAEAAWAGAELESLVLGVGVNVLPEAVPPAHLLAFPASSVAEAAGRPVDRWALLSASLRALLDYRRLLPEPGFIVAWESRLAWLGERVHLAGAQNAPVSGRMLGLSPDGWLRLETAPGEVAMFQAGELSLRRE